MAVKAEYIGVGECAKKLKTSAPHLSHLAKAGKIPFKKVKNVRKFDVKAVRKALKALRDPSKDGQRAWAKKQKGKGAQKAAAGPDAEEKKIITTANRLNEARITKEKLAAKRLEFEFKKLTGEMIEVNQVINANKQIDEVIRKKLLALPSRCALRCASQKNPKKVKTILDEAVNDILEDLYKMREGGAIEA